MAFVLFWLVVVCLLCFVHACCVWFVVFVVLCGALVSCGFCGGIPFVVVCLLLWLVCVWCWCDCVCLSWCVVFRCVCVFVVVVVLLGSVLCCVVSFVWVRVVVFLLLRGVCGVVCFVWVWCVCSYGCAFFSLLCLVGLSCLLVFVVLCCADFRVCCVLR